MTVAGRRGPRLHLVARMGVIPENVVMVYAPRDSAEIGALVGLVRSALAFARGDSVRSRSE